MRSAKSVMVYTSVPSDYCDTDVVGIVQQAHSDVNSLEKDSYHSAEERNRDYSFSRHWGIVMPYQTGAFAILLRLCYAHHR
jgi:hypothetical protein